MIILTIFICSLFSLIYLSYSLDRSHCECKINVFLFGQRSPSQADFFAFAKLKFHYKREFKPVDGKQNYLTKTKAITIYLRFFCSMQAHISLFDDHDLLTSQNIDPHIMNVHVAILPWKRYYNLKDKVR